jgi:Arc/MetJ family transcription regulator
MATAKVSVSIDENLLSEARHLVGIRGLSSYVNQALQRELQRDRLRALLSELEAQNGPVDASVMEEVRGAWPEPAEPLHRSA